MHAKDWLAIVIMPALITIGAGALAINMQNRSFRANQVFALKLNQINSGAQASVETLRDVDKAIREIRAEENWMRDQITNPTMGLKHDVASYRNGDYLAGTIDTLKDSKVRVDAIVASSEATGAGKTVASAADSYSKELARFIGCLQDNQDFRCADSSTAVLSSLRAIVMAHTTAANNLIRESK
jgi:hypothetical protein